ncbi:MAG: DUF438 domain-containing protein [Candidatus Micrarchaeota archaeon]
MDSVEKLTHILKRLNAGEDPEKLRGEAQEFLASVDPADLSIAEQKLMEAGLAPEDLRHLCSAHLGMLGDELDRFKKSLEPGHVIHTMVCEHDRILGFLDELEKVNKKIQKMKNYRRKSGDFKTLMHIAEHLVGAEPHHKREEEVLFPELEKRNVYGPPQVMRMEHEELRRRKKELRTLAKNADKIEFEEFKKKLDSTSRLIVMTLRDHIFKENNILYPTALRVIEDKKIWDRMRAECDRIGYCCFTPKT